jgi:hypothetical protein
MRIISCVGCYGWVNCPKQLAHNQGEHNNLSQSHKECAVKANIQILFAMMACMISGLAFSHEGVVDHLHPHAEPALFLAAVAIAAGLFFTLRRRSRR